MLCSRPWPALVALIAALGGLLHATAPAAAQEVQLRCDGTLLEAQGGAEERRPLRILRLALAVEAEDPSADEALGLLQRRLAAVRAALQNLQVRELEVSSPTTFTRPAQRDRAAVTRASLRVSGEILPGRFQELVRQVGGQPGVRLEPVTAVADSTADAAVRRQLLRTAYQDALAQAREMAAAIGVGAPAPLLVQIQSGFRPLPRAAVSEDAAAAAPFDPEELPEPVERLQLMARFCAR